MRESLDPALIRDLWVETAAGVLRCRDEGRGPTIVLVHELGGSLDSWQPLVDALAHEVRVVRFDQRGSGGSYGPVRPFTLNDLVDDLDQVLTARGLTHPVHLVGAAFGATQSIAFAAQRPDAVASLTLLAPAVSTGEASARVMRQRAALALEEGMASVEAMSLDRAWPPERRSSTDAFADYRGRYLTNDPRGYAWHHEAMLTSDARDDLERVEAPTLVVAGSHDRVRPPALLRKDFAGRPDTEVVEIDASHFLAVEHPHAVAEQLTRFLGLPRDGADRAIHRDGDPLDDEQLAAVQEAVDGTRGRIPAPMRAWVSSPEFARRAQALGETLRYHTSLDPRLSELAVVVTARLWRSDYEWRVHAPIAVRAGVAADVVETIRRGHRPQDLPEDEAVVLDLCIALHCHRRICDDLFQRAVRTLGPSALVETVGLLGYYTLVSMTLNAYRIGVDDAPSPFPPL